MNNLNAALGLTQMDKLDFFVKQKEKISEIYTKGFKNNKFIKLIKPIAFSKPNWWLFTILIKHRQLNAKILLTNLLKKKVQTRRLWQPMNLSKPYKKYLTIGNKQAKNLYKNALSLPSSVNLRIEDQKKIIRLINNFCDL